MAEVLEQCPHCRGTGVLSNDGQGNNVLCETCDGYGEVYRDRRK